MSTAQETDAETATTPQTQPSHPPHTRLYKKRRRLPHLDHCLNCGRLTGPTDNYCPECGQKNEDETVPLQSLVVEFLSEIASWDSKLLRTVIPLLFRPGFLTNEYLAGRRVRYLSPLKMYLVISAIFFLVLPYTGLMPDLNLGQNTSAVRTLPSVPKHVFVSKVKRYGPIEFDVENDPLGSLPKTVTAFDAQQRDPHNNHHDGFWKALLLRQVVKARQDKLTFLQSVVQGLVNDLPKMMFGLLPLFALLLKVTYLRRRRLYIEHLIFAFHSHAFLFTLLTLAAFASKAGADMAVTWTTGASIITVYLLAALRRVYKQGWVKTGVKFLWLGFSYVILLLIAFLLTAISAFLMA